MISNRRCKEVTGIVPEIVEAPDFQTPWESHRSTISPCIIDILVNQSLLAIPDRFLSNSVLAYKALGRDLQDLM